MDTKTLFQQFRQKLYQILPKLADAVLDFIDALTVAGHVASPIALSEEAPFRRKFSSIYDVLSEGRLEPDQLHRLLAEAQPAECDQIADYEVYALDTTPDERPEADTLADRGLLKAQKNGPVRVGQKFSWLVRLVKPGSSWIAPWDVRRVKTDSNDNQTAAAQVQALAGQNSRPKVVVADSLYANQVFLAGPGRQDHHRPGPVTPELDPDDPYRNRPGAAGASKHGRPSSGSAVARQTGPSSFQLGWQSIRLSAWHGLHLRQLPTLVGLALRVEFLKADGTLRYQRPMWLFWTGPETVALEAICRMYLWRFAIEHAFRFMKRHLGLNAHCLTDPDSIQRWMWLCALAYWQLLLMGRDVDDLCPAWYPRKAEGAHRWLTPGQVQRSAGRFLVKLGTPADPPRPAGKGWGRAKGYHPTPRQRYPVVRKGQKTSKKAAQTTFPAV
jgi:hypothetical protein